MLEKKFDASKLWNQIVHYYIDKKGLSKEQANEIAERGIKKETLRRTCQNFSCGHLNIKHIRNSEHCLVETCSCTKFIKPKFSN